MGVGVRMMAMGAAWPWRRRRGNHFLWQKVALGPFKPFRASISRLTAIDSWRFSLLAVSGRREITPET